MVHKTNMSTGGKSGTGPKTDTKAATGDGGLAGSGSIPDGSFKGAGANVVETKLPNGGAPKRGTRKRGGMPY